MTTRDAEPRRQLSSTFRLSGSRTS